MGKLGAIPRFQEVPRFYKILVKYAGSGDSSDEARFRHFAATSLMMANQIGVARTILANLPITRHSQDRGRPLLGYVPLAPHRAHRVRRDPEPEGVNTKGYKKQSSRFLQMV